MAVLLKAFARFYLNVFGGKAEEKSLRAAIWRLEATVDEIVSDMKRLGQLRRQRFSDIQVKCNALHSTVVSALSR